IISSLYYFLNSFYIIRRLLPPRDAGNRPRRTADGRPSGRSLWPAHPRVLCQRIRPWMTGRTHTPWTRGSDWLQKLESTRYAFTQSFRVEPADTRERNSTRLNDTRGSRS